MARALQTALKLAFPEKRLVDLRIVETTEGTNRRLRLALEWSGGRGPDSVFVKMSGRLGHRLALLALRATAAEARLALSGLELPLEHPQFYAAGIDTRRLCSIVVMEDLVEKGARISSAISPLSALEVASGLEALAALHARYWEAVPSSLAFLRPWRLGSPFAPVSALSLDAADRRLRRLGRPLDPRISLRLLERGFRESALRAALGPQTLLHGDPHLCNSYVSKTGVTGFFDFQLVRTGNWSHDVSYFVVSSLEPGERRRDERELLAHYLAALAKGGARAPTFDEAWESYRAGPSFGLPTWLHTLTGRTLQPVEACTATIARFESAYLELDTAEVVATRTKDASLPPTR